MSYEKVSGQRYTEEQFLEAIKESGGSISEVCRRVGCHYQTARAWLNKPGISEFFEDEMNRIHDMAQNNLVSDIEDGSIKTSMWWLSRQRRAEFGDGVDITSGNKPIIFRVVYDE